LERIFEEPSRIGLAPNQRNPFDVDEPADELAAAAPGSSRSCAKGAGRVLLALLAFSFVA
jgi:hypothetical protein